MHIKDFCLRPEINELSTNSIRMQDKDKNAKKMKTIFTVAK